VSTVVDSVQGQSLATRAISRAGQARPVPGNTVEVLIDGPAVFSAMLDLIAEASTWVHFENYIIRSDDTGWRFAHALAERAQRGVKICLLYDWLGCVTTSRKLWTYLRGHGVILRAFNRPKPVDMFANLTRDHRKLVVADGRRAVLGGVCIGDDWSGQPERGILPWRDTAVEIHGPAAAVLDQSFADMWRLTGAPLPPDQYASDVAPAGEVAVQVVTGQPGRGRVYRILDLLAAGSTDRMWITDAYLVAPRRLLYALRNAAQAGVDVRLLLPSASDVPVVRNLTRIGYRDLLSAGVRIYEWQGAMLHAKTQVADGRWCRIGSSNLNAASLLGNYELDVLVDDPTVADVLEAQFRKDIARASEIVLPQKRTRGRLGRARLASQQPSVAPDKHRISGRERRKRMVLALRTVATGARRSTFLPIGIGLSLLAILFFLLPRLMGYLFGGLLIWLGIAAWLEAFRRRAAGT
jgi:cardiolipin synthase